jgi:hypothetical protein
MVHEFRPVSRHILPQPGGEASSCPVASSGVLLANPLDTLCWSCAHPPIGSCTPSVCTIKVSFPRLCHLGSVYSVLAVLTCSVDAVHTVWIWHRVAVVLLAHSRIASIRKLHVHLRFAIQEVCLGCTTCCPAVERDAVCLRIWGGVYSSPGLPVGPLLIPCAL